MHFKKVVHNIFLRQTGKTDFDSRLALNQAENPHSEYCKWNYTQYLGSLVLLFLEKFLFVTYKSVNTCNLSVTTMCYVQHLDFGGHLLASKRSFGKRSSMGGFSIQFRFNQEYNSTFQHCLCVFMTIWMNLPHLCHKNEDR